MIRLAGLCAPTIVVGLVMVFAAGSALGLRTVERHLEVEPREFDFQSRSGAAGSDREDRRHRRGTQDHG